MSPRRSSRVAFGLTAALLLAACSGNEPPQSAPTEQPKPPPSSASPSPSTGGVATGTPGDVGALAGQRLDWKDCDDGFSCATVQVPLDYDAPDAGTIGLAVVRLPAGDHNGRIGSLLINPGGPGASGVEYARAARSVLNKPLLRRYDIVGFDPRGVAGSAPVRCQSDRETDAYLASDASPDDAAEEREAVALAKAFAARCGAEAPRVLPHVGTVDAARDMDLLRAVLGDEKLHYFGRSYGTALGAAYAEQFPARVGRLVLDGALDPAATSGDVNREQARGFELALRSYVDDCLTADGCPLPAPREAALRWISDLLARLDRDPLQGSGGRQVTQSLATIGIAAALYSQDTWPVLSQAFAQAEQGSGGTLLLLADAYADRGPDGRYRSNSNDAIYAVSCLDRPDRSTVPDVRASATALARESPRFGAFIAWGALPCTYWPAKGTAAPAPVRAPGAAPILVVGTARDPATPLIWAEALAEQLESGVLLVRDGDGHLAYKRGNECVDDAVDTYLLDGRAPPDGTRC